MFGIDSIDYLLAPALQPQVIFVTIFVVVVACALGLLQLPATFLMLVIGIGLVAFGKTERINGVIMHEQLIRLFFSLLLLALCAFFVGLLVSYRLRLVR